MRTPQPKKNIADNLRLALEPLAAEAFAVGLYSENNISTQLQTIFTQNPYINLHVIPPPNYKLYLIPKRGAVPNTISTKISFNRSTIEIKNVGEDNSQREIDMEVTTTLAVNDINLDTMLFETILIRKIIEAIFYNGRPNSDFNKTYNQYLMENDDRLKALLREEG